nr:MAG TPA: hypothetical protein [Caudoviricetes sp.]
MVVLWPQAAYTRAPGDYPWLPAGVNAVFTLSP